MTDVGTLLDLSVESLRNPDAFPLLSRADA
jgi:hypothetical protein